LLKRLTNTETWPGWVNDETVQINPVILVNGKAASPDEVLADRAKITTSQQMTAAEVLTSLGVKAANQPDQTIEYTLNGNYRTRISHRLEIRVNDYPATLATQIKPGDHLRYKYNDEVVRIIDIIPLGEQMMTIRLNGRHIEVRAQVEVYSQDEPVGADTPLSNGMKLTMPPPACLVSDLLNYIELKPVMSGKLTLKVNGEKAGFTTPVNPDDQVEISWE